eukprot:CAMPEP_0196155586 /NCGR_PEP_ID=MMETSP0910-20130528/40910_1 /TAXON_ID=49265 /ORGANISM="Thalassiosira rotula, Strain GSO102" /LENGTH=77 /DNA_ID=CAMNT_0041419835 /DNA_START=42 /DNA_END=272 /DNA_ORIENTATION=+
MSTSPTKVCSDMEWKPEVDAEERMKRKAAVRRDPKAAKRNKRANIDKKPSSEAATAVTQSGKRKKGRPRSNGKTSSS